MNARELKMDDRQLLAERDRQRAAKRAAKARTAPRRKPGAEKKRLSREEQNARTAEVRAEVWKRMNPHGVVAALCECGCGRLVTWNTFHMDHWIGGSSREELTTVENCWGLDPACDEDKTNMGGPNRASVEEWNRWRREHCGRHGIRFIPRKPTRYYGASSLRAQDGEGETR